MKKSFKEDFLKQIEDYNDFIVQNDLDIELVNPDHDYDFSAFTSPEDWAVESDRLADRLSDRKIEIKQNEDAGEFAGMELEGGMPSFESVKNMFDEEFEAYEAKYLTPTEAETAKEPPAVKAVNDTVTPDTIDTNDTEVPLEVTPPDQNKTASLDLNTSVVDNPNPASVEKDPEYEFSLPLTWELFKGTHPGVKNAVDAVDSVGKVIDQGQPINTLQDAGRGVMSGLADTAGSVADLGGLVPNRVADMAHDSADWWRDQYEIVDSEAGNVGSNIGSEAVAGVAGGAIGKGIGKAYLGMKEGGEALRKRATTVAKDTEKRARLNGQSPLESAIARQNSYENMTNVPPRKSMLDALLGTEPQFKRSTVGDVPYTMPLTLWDKAKKFHTEKMLDQGSKHSRTYDMDNVFEPTSPRGNPATVRMFDTLGHNVNSAFGNRAMLKSNDAELNDLFSKGTPLDRALKIRQDRWDQIPNTARDAGILMGMGTGSQ